MKVYTKPEILFEDFSLSINIAAGCEIETSFARNTCAYIMEDMGGISVFTSSVAACTDVKLENGIYDKDGEPICYHNPSEVNNIFSS